MKSYLCFTCYQYHPEMRGIPENELTEENKVCLEEKCTCKGQLLEAAEFDEASGKMVRVSE